MIIHRSMLKEKRVTETQAEELFSDDVKQIEHAINLFMSVPLRQHQYDVLFSLVFNNKIKKFRHSSILKKNYWT